MLQSDVAVYYVAQNNADTPGNKIQGKAPVSGKAVLSPEALQEKTERKKSFFPFLSYNRNVTVKAVSVGKTAKNAEVKTQPFEKKRVVNSHQATVEEICLDDPQVKKIFFSYYNDIREEIKKHTVYPQRARQAREQGLAYISFVLKRDGAIREIVLRESSGSTVLDAAALDSIRCAAPFAPFPDVIKESEVKLNVPISFELS